jgi:hypothetical protein
MPLKNPLTITPAQVRTGDKFAVVVICHVMSDGGLRYYRAPYPPTNLIDDVPQGAFMGTHLSGLELNHLFPTISAHLRR